MSIGIPYATHVRDPRNMALVGVCCPKCSLVVGEIIPGRRSEQHRELTRVQSRATTANNVLAEDHGRRGPPREENAAPTR